MPNLSYRLVLICKGCAWWDKKPKDKNSKKHKCYYYADYSSLEDGFCNNAIPREEVHKE